MATLGPGPVPGLRFGAPGSAYLHIGVASAVPGRNGETPSDRPLLWAACPGWDETSHHHPHPQQGGVVSGGTRCQPVAPLGKLMVDVHPHPLCGKMSNWEGYFKQDLVCLCWLECGGHWSGEAGTGVNSSALLHLCWFPRAVHHSFLGGKVAVL